MGIFNEFNKKEKPVFTGLRFGFGSGGSAPTGGSVTDEQTYVYSSDSVVSASRPGPSAGKEMQSVRFYVQGAGGGANPTGPGNTDQSGGFTDYTHESNLQDTYKLVICLLYTSPSPRDQA